ncbi:MAG: ATP-binding protein [Thermoproteota archaeon]
MRNTHQKFAIYLFGPDGSGKSTLAKLFRGYMFSCGVYVHVSWFRGSHLFASVLARFLSRFSSFRGHVNPYYRIAIPLKLRPIWVLIEFSSLLPHYLLRKFLSIFHPVVGDRGLLDFMVWIIVTLNHPKFLTTPLGGFLARLAVKEKNIYVKADPAVLRRRTAGVTLSFLVKEIACYNVLAKYYASHTIDTTSKAPKESLGELLECIRKP